jgi:hypothetical protein
MSKTPMSFRIESSNGVTAGPYKTREEAKKAARRANDEAPGQGWHAVPEWVYEDKQR